MNSEKFRGTTVALVTPFHKENQQEINEPVLRQLVDWQIKQGTTVILAGGTTGESATLSHDEHHQLMEIVVDQVDGRVPVLCGSGSNSTAEAVSLTQYAEKAGADAVLVVGPYYNKPTQEGFYRHYRTVAEATSLPVIVYNVPGRTGSNIMADTTLRLAEIDNIIGIKEASGDMDQIMKILQNRPEDFLLLSGDDALAFPLLALGSDGVISVVANEAPALLADMVRSAFAGDWQRARELHFRLLPLMTVNFIETNPIPVKTALGLMGKIDAEFRLPMVPMSTAGTQKLKSVLYELDLIEGK